MIPALILAFVIPARVAGASGGFALAPGVVVDAGADAAYVMSPSRGIDAIELSSGKQLWTSTAAAKPLLAFDGRLAAQAQAGDGLSIVVLDAKDPAKSPLKAHIPLPRGQEPPIDGRLGVTSTLKARAEPGALAVSWSVVTNGPAGGTPRPATRHETRGSARIDLKTGRVQLLASDGTVETEKPLPAQVRSYVESGALLAIPPIRAGDFIVAAETRGGTAVVKRWEARTGRELFDVEEEPGFLVSSVSGDERLVLACKAAGPDPATSRERYDWSVHSIETGEKVARLRLPVGPSPFLVRRSALIYLSQPYGLSLRGVDLNTGAEIWSAVVRETAYRGPFPP